MRKINFCILILLVFSLKCLGQEVISFNTSYYGDKYAYVELYLSDDSTYISEYKQIILSRSVKWYALPNRQKFILVDKPTFKEVRSYLKKHDENISSNDFPQPFREIYYVEMYNYRKDDLKITSAFGDDKDRALAYFRGLKDILETKAASKTLINELSGIMAELKK